MFINAMMNLNMGAAGLQVEYASNQLVQDVCDFILSDTSRHLTTTREG